MPLSSIVLFALSGVFLVLYLMRRSARLRREEKGE